MEAQEWFLVVVFTAFASELIVGIAVLPMAVFSRFMTENWSERP